MLHSIDQNFMDVVAEPKLLAILECFDLVCAQEENITNKSIWFALQTNLRKAGFHGLIDRYVFDFQCRHGIATTTKPNYKLYRDGKISKECFYAILNLYIRERTPEIFQTDPYYLKPYGRNYNLHRLMERWKPESCVAALQKLVGNLTLLHHLHKSSPFSLPATLRFAY